MGRKQPEKEEILRRIPEWAENSPKRRKVKV